MIVSHWGQFSIIYTARRHLGNWQGVARIKPTTRAPEPFSETGSYASKTTFRSEAAAELATQKEVLGLLKEAEIDSQAFDSLKARCDRSIMKMRQTTKCFSDRSTHASL